MSGMGGEGSTLRILVVVEPGIDGVFRHVEGLIHHLLAEKQEVTEPKLILMGDPGEFGKSAQDRAT